MVVTKMILVTTIISIILVKMFVIKIS